MELDAENPARLHFALDAQELFTEWRAELEGKIRGDELHPALISHLSKYRSLMPSLAVLFHLAEAAARGGDADTVSLRHAQQAAALCEYLESHARRVYSCIVTPQLRVARELADKIKHRKVGTDGFFSCREVYRKGWSGLDSPEAVKLAVESPARCRMGSLRGRRIIRPLGPRASVQPLRSKSGGMGMSTPARHPATRSRWINWKPKPQISAEPAETEATETMESVSDVFEGATSAESTETEPRPDPAKLACASDVLKRAGVRIMALEGGVTIGVWSDLDGPEVRAALRAFGSDRLAIRYLDGAGIPMRYKLRRVEGEPVPMNVLSEMERHREDPWKLRDRRLNEMGWCSRSWIRRSGRRRR